MRRVPFRFPVGPGAASNARGFALLAVLLVLAVLGVVGAEFAFSMRLEASATRAHKERIIGAHLTEAAVSQAIREIIPDYRTVGAPDGILTFYGQDGQPRPRLQRDKVKLGAGTYSYTLTDEQSRLNVNTAAPAVLDKLLQCRGVEKSDRDVIVDSVQDWKDADENHRLNGAESDDTYLKLEVPYRSRNGNLGSVRELLQIKGVTKEIFYGTAGSPGLVDDVSVRAPGTNINTVTPRVLCALGFSTAEMETLVNARNLQPYFVTPGQFGGRRLAATSQMFRIIAEGAIDGRVGARVTAVVWRRRTTQGTSILTLEWFNR